MLSSIYRFRLFDCSNVRWIALSGASAPRFPCSIFPIESNEKKQKYELIPHIEHIRIAAEKIDKNIANRVVSSVVQRHRNKNQNENKSSHTTNRVVRSICQLFLISPFFSDSAEMYDKFFDKNKNDSKYRLHAHMAQSIQ